MSTIYLVTRHDGPKDVLIALLRESDATQHAADLTAASGIEHQVDPVTLADAVPEMLEWHSLAVDLELDGSERWRHEEAVHTFRGHRGAQTEPTVRWEVVVRVAPSQPPSRVRIVTVGPNRDWCVAAARTAWDEACADNSYREAAALEEMFSSGAGR